MALFSLPFIAGGLVLMAVGIALLAMRMRGTARRGELVVDTRFLFWGWYVAASARARLTAFRRRPA